MLISDWSSDVCSSDLGLKMVHVPYRGAAPALADVAAGQVPAMMVDLAAGAGFIKAGKVRALAVANPTRLPQLPDVPTFAETGYKQVQCGRASVRGRVCQYVEIPVIAGQ